MNLMAREDRHVRKAEDHDVPLVRRKRRNEVDELWGQLSAGGTEGQCGWLKDKFGLSWQIIPTALLELMDGKDPKSSKRVMEAMFQMRKIDIGRLEQA
jgi:predicted 3-demethylubiquinone-9 3-methyltransferase (glyoxalase superfamily)